MKPFTKLTGLFAAIAAVIASGLKDRAVALLLPVFGPTVSEVISWGVVAGAVLVTLLAHSFTGTGGTGATNDPKADKGAFISMTTK